MLFIRNNLLKAVSIILAICSPYCACATNINKLITSYAKSNNVLGMAVIVYQGNNLKNYFYGYRDVKRHDPIDVNTIFEVGSITKTFVGLSFAKELLNGSLNFDSKITTINGSEDFSNTTLLELATHTSGMPYYISNLKYNASASDKNRKELSNFLSHYTPLFIPGTNYSYSNLGYSLLAEELANRRKMTVSQMIAQDILYPLGMYHTYMTVPKIDWNKYSYGYTVDDKLARSPDEGLIPGGWAIKSSVSDMGKYLMANMIVGDDVSSTEKKLQLYKAVEVAQTGYLRTDTGITSFGLAWNIKDSLYDINKTSKNVSHKSNFIAVEKIKDPKYCATCLIEKTGSTDGFRAYIGMIPQKRIGVIILVNKFTNSREDIVKLGHKIMING